MTGRRGIWRCPSCSTHQTWKSRDKATTRLDRKCTSCNTRIRVTLNRSDSGRGRKQQAEVWERPFDTSMEELQSEAELRNSDEAEVVSEEKNPSHISQQDLPPLWGAGWRPKAPLDFSSTLPQETARSELMRFLVERHDGHVESGFECWNSLNPPERFNGNSFHEFCESFCDSFEKRLTERIYEPGLATLATQEIIPRRSGSAYLDRRAVRMMRDVALCLRRIAYTASITVDDRFEWQRWMHRTRALDEHLKDLFMNGVKTPNGSQFGGKGFRSTWQEGVVACASSMTRAIDLSEDSIADADVVAPMIRDVGLALSMGQTPLEIFNAQMGKADSYMDGGVDSAGGRDLHVGNWHKRVLPPTAPLPIASATATGVALAANRLARPRFHLAPVGEGCSSSGEFWEAMNLAGARGLPISFMIQNNQIALDTFTVGQSGAETFGDKGHSMGIPSWSIDGSDPAEFYTSTAVAREFALDGGGPTLIHVETMRGCGHAHHHDDLYLGAASGNPPGYVDRELLTYWSEKDPLPNHRDLLVRLGFSENKLSKMEAEEQALVDAARNEMENTAWPEGNSVTKGITSLHDASTHSEQFDRFGVSLSGDDSPVSIGEVDIEFSDAANSWTYSKAIQNGMVSLADKYGESIVFMGEDMEVAGAFGMNLPLKARGHSDKLLDMPLSEAIIIHSATGAALGGMRPLAEIQFGGFAALAMNPLINNAAQLRWRWGAEVPLTVRIPLGAKTRSGPFHANMIESWFANDPGLVIVFPSTPQDAYDLLVESHALNDPVVFLEHIGLYGLRGGKTGWGHSINQIVDTNSVHKRLANGENSIGEARVVRGGKDVTIVTWGAMVHVALEAAETAAKRGIEVEIVDLRTLLPFDAQSCIDSVRRTGRLIVLQEAQYTGGLGHTVSSRILEEAFWNLENAPVVIGALDTPVPFSPPLEDHTIPTSDLVVRHIRRMCE
ncbi:MAG: alpha-ketoacid dehydrogenase subunit alpha/beta [Candidatus Thalassarchaeaceae archaeon]